MTDTFKHSSGSIKTVTMGSQIKRFTIRNFALCTKALWFPFIGFTGLVHNARPVWTSSETDQCVVNDAGYLVGVLYSITGPDLHNMPSCCIFHHFAHVDLSREHQNVVHLLSHFVFFTYHQQDRNLYEGHLSLSIKNGHIHVCQNLLPQVQI